MSKSMKYIGLAIAGIIVGLLLYAIDNKNATRDRKSREQADIAQFFLH